MYSQNYPSKFKTNTDSNQMTNVAIVFSVTWVETIYQAEKAVKHFRWL